MAKPILVDPNPAMTGAIMGPPTMPKLPLANVPPTARVLATIAAIQQDVPVRRITDPPPKRRKPKTVRNRRKAQRAARRRNRG